MKMIIKKQLHKNNKHKITFSRKIVNFIQSFKNYTFIEKIGFYSFIIAVLALILQIIAYIDPSNSEKEFSYRAQDNIIFQNSDSTFNILIIPFERYNFNKSLNLEKIVLDEFNKYNPDGIFALLDTNLRYVNDSIISINALEKNADIVITGKYSETTSLTTLTCHQFYYNAIDANGTMELEGHINPSPYALKLIDIPSIEKKYKTAEFTDKEIINGEINDIVIDDVYLSLALKHFDSKKYHRCLEILNKRKWIDSSTYIIRYKSICYFMINDLRNHIICEKEILKYEHNNIKAMYNLAFSYDKLNVLDSSIYYYKKLIKNDTANIEFCKNLGKLYFKNKNYNLAIETYEKAIKLDFDSKFRKEINKLILEAKEMKSTK